MKKGPIIKEVERLKAKEDLRKDIEGFFEEKDKTKRGTEGIVEDMIHQSEEESKLHDMLYEASQKEHPINPEIEPMFNSLFITAKLNKKVNNGIIISQAMVGDLECDYQEIQTVMAVGPQVQQAKVGRKVCVDFKNFLRQQTETMAQKVDKVKKLEVPIVTIDDVEYIHVSERDLKYTL